MRQLSKSKIIAFRQCPKRMWLELNRPELCDDSASEVAFAIGNEVGEVARRIYDPEQQGMLIDVGMMGWESAYERTEAWLKEHKAPLFEAALRIPGALALADVMLPVAGDGAPRWRMIEVKSSGAVKDYHLEDLAVQSHIASASGINLSSAAVAHIDTSFVYPGEGNYEGLLKEVELTAEVRSMAEEVVGWIWAAQETAALAEEPEIETGAHCSSPFQCSFIGYCNRNEPKLDYPLSSFYRLTKGHREQMEAAGVTGVRDAPDSLLSEANRIIKRQTLAGEAWFDATGAAASIARYPGTAYFLDFETIGFAVPVWPGTRPYQQIPFQFSLHIAPPGGGIEHHEFLDLSREDPTESFAKALIGFCGTSGPIYVYNAAFERRIMRETGARHPRFAPALEALCLRLVDLEPIARQHYYHPQQHGSWSLKAVLPAICPDLSYKDLEGVANGNMAQQAFQIAINPSTTPERRREIETQLLAYCRLDTFALLRLWQYFSGQEPTPAGLI